MICVFRNQNEILFSFFLFEIGGQARNDTNRANYCG